jgi:acetyl esterase/lipase
MKKLDCFVRKIVIVFILLAGPIASSAGTTVERNVVYGMYSGLALLMDVHLPDEPNGYGLIMIPGSGWEAPLGYGAEQLKHSYEIEHIFGLAELSEAGYAVFIINHRATPRFEYPAPIEDAQRAVRFVRHNAAKFGVDAEHIGAIGGSSGGHLVSLLGTLDGLGITQDADPVNQQSAKVQVVVAIYPAVDFLDFETSNPWAGGAITALLGPTNPGWKPPPLFDPAANKLYQEASPTHYLTADDAPFLLIHGDADSVVPFSQSERMQAGLREANVEAKLIRVPGGDHGPGLIQENGPDHVSDILEWLDNHLKK